MGRQQVLHVEGDADLRRVVAAAMPQHVDFAVAHSLADARAMLQRRRFTVVVLDLGLPDGDGLEFLPELHAQRPPPAVVVLSGKELPAVQHSGVHGVLITSPNTVRDLLDMINGLVTPMSHTAAVATAAPVPEMPPLPSGAPLA